MNNIDCLEEETMAALRTFDSHMGYVIDELEEMSVNEEIDFVKIYDLKDKFTEESIKIVRYCIDKMQDAINEQLTKGGIRPLYFKNAIGIEDLIKMPTEEGRKIIGKLNEKS